MKLAAARVGSLVFPICLGFQDGASLPDFARAIPAAIRPPEALGERIAWAERGLEPERAEAIQEAATRMLASALPDSLEALERAARSEHWRTRAAALGAGVRGAGLVRDARGRTRLRELAWTARRDPVRAVRRQAARLLAEVGDHADAALPGLAEDPFFDVRLEAVRALARGGSTDSIPTIAARLRDRDPQVAALAVDVLPRLGAAGIAALGEFLADPKIPAELRDRALAVLREAGSIDGAEEALRGIAREAVAAPDARALAQSLLLVYGSVENRAAAIAILLPAVLGLGEMGSQDAAIEGLVAAGPAAAEAARAALLDPNIPRYSYDRLLQSFPRIARENAPRLLMGLFDVIAPERDGDRAEIVQTLAHCAGDELTGFVLSRWGASGGRTRREMLRAFRARADVPESVVEKALSDDLADLRKLGFALAVRARGIATERCIEAIRAEPDAALRAEWSETLPRVRPDEATRGFLLDELDREDAERVESLAAGLDVYTGDEDVVARLVEHHQKAYARQLESLGSEDAQWAWRARRIFIRTIGRIGGPSALAFLRERARAERAIDAELGAEAVRGLAALAPDDPLLLTLLASPSLAPVRIEAAIAAARRGHAQGVFTLAGQLRALDGDLRRRALDAMAQGRPPQRRGFLLELAVDAKGVYGDESRADAIRELATLEDSEAFEALAGVAKGDRSLDARIEAIHTLGRRGGDDAARVLVEIAGAIRAQSQRNDFDELLLQAATVALGNARSRVGAGPLLAQLFERPLRDAATRLLDPDSRRSSLEMRRRYDREREAMVALTRLGAAAAEPLDRLLASMHARGELQLLDPTYLLELAEAWLEAFPAAAERLAEAAPALGGDLEFRFRSLLLRSQTASDRRAAGNLLDAAHALASSGAVDGALTRILGSTDPSAGRRPRRWLHAAVALARSDSAFADRRSEEGLRFLDSAARRGSQDTRCLLQVASALQSHGETGRARDFAAQAHSLAPNDRSICETYAWLSLQAGDAALAYSLFQTAQTLDEDDDATARSARFGAACALVGLRRVSEATDVVRALLREDPDLLVEVRRSPYLAPVREALALTDGETIAGSVPAR